MGSLTFTGKLPYRLPTHCKMLIREVLMPLTKTVLRFVRLCILLHQNLCKIVQFIKGEENENELRGTLQIYFFRLCFVLFYCKINTNTSLL